jgi:cytochrome P450
MSTPTAQLAGYPFGTPHTDDDDPGLARLRAAEPVTRVRINGDQEVWLATRYEDVRQVLSDPRFSRAANLTPGSPTLFLGEQLPDMMLNMDPPGHTRVRSLVSRGFTARAIERLRPRIQAITDDLLADLAAAGPPADLVAGLSRPLTTMVICELIGVPFAERERLLEFVQLLGAAITPTADEARRIMTESSGYLLGLIARKRRQPADDLLTALTETHDGGDRLTEAELLNTTLLLFAAGHDTTLNHLVNSVLVLFRHPDQLARLIGAPDLVPAAVEELLRYVRLTSGGLTRVATADVVVGGVRIRAGEAVIPIGHSANRDAAVFDQPDELDLNRPNAAGHLQFGHGIHYCLGAALARAELQVALLALLTRFPSLRLAVDEADLRWQPGHLVRRLQALPVTWATDRRR